MFRNLLLLLCIIVPSIAHADRRCFFKTCKKSHCRTCYPQKVYPQKVLVDNEITVESNTKIQNNILLPKAMQAMQFQSVEIRQKPSRRRFQFSNNLPNTLPQQAQPQIPQPQIRQSANIALNRSQINSNAFLFQNIVTTGTNIESTVTNKGYSKAKFTVKQKK